MMANARKNDLGVNVRTKIAGLRILTVEDDADGAASMAALLRLLGHNVQISESGQPALDAARADEPEVILCHLRPQSANEYELAKRLSGNKISITPLLIAVVGLGQVVNERLSAEAGIDLHLAMPIDPNRLVDALRGFHRLRSTHTLPGDERWQHWRDDGFDSLEQFPALQPD